MHLVGLENTQNFEVHNVTLVTRPASWSTLMLLLVLFILFKVQVGIVTSDQTTQSNEIILRCVKLPTAQEVLTVGACRRISTRRWWRR